MKPKHLRWIGVVLLLVGCNPQRVPAPASTLPATTPIPPASLPTPSSIPTAFPTRTKTQAEQGQAFAGPILEAIASQSPTWSDDFSDPNSGWSTFPIEGGLWGYENGVYFIVAQTEDCCDGILDQVRPFSDFVMELDGKIVSGESAFWGVTFREGPSEIGRQVQHYAVHFNPRGPVNMIRFDGSNNTLLAEDGGTPAYRQGFETNRLQIIAQGPRIAVYVNGEPLWFAYDDALRSGVFRLRGRAGRVEFDNFKVWELAKVP